MIGYAYVTATVVLTVYGQIIIKWQVNEAGVFEGSWDSRARYLWDLVTNPWVMTSLVGAAVAALCWIAALSHLDLSRAYPFTSASFVLVLVLSGLFLGERIGVAQLAGGLLIVVGLVVGSQT